MARHWSSWIQWVLWILNLTAAGTSGAAYVPDGAIYVIESASQSHIDTYNILEMEVTLHSPDLKLQWYIEYTGFNLEPVTGEVSKEMGIFIEEHISPEGQTSTRLYQKMQHYASNGIRNTILTIQSEDGRLMHFDRNIYILEPESPVEPYSTDSPEQRYITRRPPPLAKWSAENAAEITAEVWLMNAEEDRFCVWFTKSEERAPIFSRETCVYDNLHNGNPDSTNIDGVSVTVEQKIVYGLMRYSITVHTQRSGLVAIGFEYMYHSRYLGPMVMFTESISETEESWLDNKGYSVQFRRPDPEELPTGREFVLQCHVSGENLSPEMIEMRLNGRKLSDVSYRKFVPGYLFVIYETSGSEEGEFECRVEDETTGVVESAFKSVTRV